MKDEGALLFIKSWTILGLVRYWMELESCKYLFHSSSEYHSTILTQLNWMIKPMFLNLGYTLNLVVELNLGPTIKKSFPKSSMICEKFTNWILWRVVTEISRHICKLHLFRYILKYILSHNCKYFKPKFWIS